MQVTYIDAQQCADVLEESVVLTKIEAPGSAVTYILTRDGVDILMFTDAVTGASVVVEPDSRDDDRGGSVHDQARDVFWDSTS